MTKKIDMKGMTFGLLTVRKESSPRKWECDCLCGRSTVVSGMNLRSGNTASCGCLRNVPSRRRLNIAGKRFGRLVAIAHKETIRGSAKWECVCDCGCLATVAVSKLRRGTTNSCGCLQIESRMKAKLLPGNKIGQHRWARTIKRNTTCTKCGSGTNLEAHHLVPVSADPSLERALSNGTVLCKQCHNDFHSTYGKDTATVSDYCDFIGRPEIIDFMTAFVGWTSLKDIKKAIHFLQLLLEMEYGDEDTEGTRTEVPGDGGNAGATSQPMRPHPNYGR